MTTFTTFDRGSAAPGNSPQPVAGRSADFEIGTDEIRRYAKDIWWSGFGAGVSVMFAASCAMTFSIAGAYGVLFFLFLGFFFRRYGIWAHNEIVKFARLREGGLGRQTAGAGVLRKAPAVEIWHRGSIS